MKNPKILIIDDEITIHKTIKKALKTEPYTLFSAKEGKEGLAILKTERPNLIFLDLRMPIMDGFEFLSRIKIKPDDPYLVVVITAHGYDQEIDKSYELGVNFFLRKPLSMIEVCCLAKKCLDLKSYELEIKTHRDILERKVKERTETIQEQLHFQQNLIDSIPTPVFFKDTELYYLGCNSAFEKLTGLGRDEIIGKKISAITSSELSEIHAQKDIEVLKQERQVDYESSVILGDASQRQMIICKAPFKNTNDKVAGMIGAMFDITDLTNAQNTLAARTKELEEANSALRVVLDQIGNAKTEVERRVFTNLKDTILPDLERLKTRTNSPRNKADIDILKTNLNKLTSASTRKLSSIYLTLSPREIQIADLVRLGKSNKSIALLLNVSRSAVEFHRNNLREKLGLKHKKVNLRSYLLNMD